MKTYQIILYNKVTGKTKKTEDFPTTSITVLKNRLSKLQEVYCESVNEVPVVSEQKIKSDGFLIKALVAESDCDFCYIAPIESI